MAERPPPTRPGEVWQADITYVATRAGWLYVAGVLDACSRKIVGWAADAAMPTSLITRAFERAIQTQRPAPGLLHHSDRGSQYASDAYRELLRSACRGQGRARRRQAERPPYQGRAAASTHLSNGIP